MGISAGVQPILPYVDIRTYGPLTFGHPQPPLPINPGPFGPIRSVSRFDPRVHDNSQPYQIKVTFGGTLVIGLDVGRPWVWSRRVTPVITGDEFSSSATYTATPVEDLVFDP